MVFLPNSLPTSLACDSVALTVHMKLVSVVLRGDKVSDEVVEVVGEVVVETVVRPPDTMVFPPIFIQVKV